MRRPFGILLIIAILVSPLSVLFTPAAPASAATYRNHIARVPTTPTSQQTVRVWMQSDTADGETAGLQWCQGSMQACQNGTGQNYTMVFGTFDTSGPAPANWRADIPARPDGTTISYQLFTRNQSGGLYGWTGFNWSYVVSDANIHIHVARVPEGPTSQQSVRVWMQSRTVLGETAGLEYNVVGTDTYVKVLGTYDDTGYPGANWRADIPAHPHGTQVRYQLFTRTQSNTDYGFTGFNWSYTVFDGDIQWNGLRHDTFDSYYRSPFGAVPAGSSVTLRFRTVPLNVDRVFIRIYQYNPSTNSTAAPIDYEMSYLQDRVEGGTNYAIWTRTIATPSSPAILYYKFRVVQRLDEDWYGDYYVDDHDNLQQGGEGVTSDAETDKSFQLTVYNPSFETPAWMQNANVYQIFPDRFRNGDIANDYCREGTTAGCPTFYGDQNVIAHTTWNEEIYDPRVSGAYFNSYGNQFYGGDLKGIQDKLDYLQAAGINTLYLTPIFKGSSNHRYDTDDYKTVDPALGGDAAYAALVKEAQRRGMYVILDGVFNHTSSDSLYFDRYHRYPGDEGACESLSSPYRSWYEFNNNNVPCGTGDYTGWFGYDSLAVLRDNSTEVRDFIYRGTGNVVQYWYERGTSGWRFDVADEISHDWWRDFRGYAKTYKPDGPLVGEVWPDATRFLLGEQLDSVMNYRFRKNILGFARGVGWKDNDNNGSNEIIGLTPSQFDKALRSVREDYPPQATAAMLNLIDSHDTNRALYVLTLEGDSGLTEAKDRLKLTALFQFAYIGAPMVYYGDEAAIDAPSKANHATNGPEDDPYNRAPYPWADESGNADIYGPADASMIDYYSKLGHLRLEHPALRTGSFETLLAGDTTASTSDNSTYAFARVSGADKAIVVLNNGGGTNSASVPVGAYFADGAQLQDALSGDTYPVSGGSISISLAARSGAILFVAPAAADTVTPTAGLTRDPAANANGWNNSSPVTVNMSAADSGSGVQELRYWIDDGAVAVVSGASTSVSVSTDNTTVNLRSVDNAGNISPLASITVRIDTTEPTTAVDTAPPTLTNSRTATFTFSSNENGATFECSLGDAAFTPCSSPQTYNDVADGTYTFRVRAVDLAGNRDATPESRSWTVDTVKPTVSMSSSVPNPTNTSPIPVTVEFSEEVDDFTAADIAASNATVGAFTKIDGDTYTFELTPAGEGAVTATIAADAAHDAAGNGNTAALQFSRTFDSERPTVAMTSLAPDPTNTSPIPVTVEFSKNVVGFEEGDISVANATVANFAAVDGNTYTFDLVPSGQGLVTANIAANVAQDAASNGNTAASQFWRTYDTSKPSVVMSSSAPNPTNTSPIPVTVQFGEDVVGFSAADISAGNATVSGFTRVDGDTYTFNLVPSGQGAVTANIAAGAAEDAAGNTSTAATQFSRTFDSARPAVTMSSTAPDPTNTSPIAVTVQFAEEVAGFTAADVVAGNATVSDFTVVDADTYTFNLVPSGQGAVTAGIADDVAQDAAGNGNTAASQFSRTYDTVAPSVSMSSTAPNPTNTSPILVTVQFAEEVAGFTAADIFAENATVGAFTAVDGDTYTFELIPKGQGTVTANLAAGAAQDAAGNGNTAASQLSRTYDSLRPAVTINQAADQADPASSGPINFTVVFDEPVTGFGAEDVALGGTAGASSAAVTGSGTTYNVAVSGMTANGTVVASVVDGAALDAAGNTSAASTSADNTVTYTGAEGPANTPTATVPANTATTTATASATATATATATGPADTATATATAPANTATTTATATATVTVPENTATTTATASATATGPANTATATATGPASTATVTATASATATGPANTATTTATASATSTGPANTATAMATGLASTATATATGPASTATATATGPASTATATATGPASTATATATGPANIATATATGPANTATATATGPASTATATATGPASTATATATGPASTATATATGQASTATATGTPPTSTATVTGTPPTSTSTTTATATATAPANTTTPTATSTLAPGQQFSDVPPSDPFFVFIGRLYEEGVISGYADNTFRPYNPVTRGQIAKLVAISAGFDEPPGPQIFSDVPPGHPFYDYINRLANRGIVSGYPCPQLLSPHCTPENPMLFRPEANATRGQLAKIVSNAAGYDEAVSGQHYADVPPTGEGSQFYEWIMRLTARGVMGGYTCGGPGMPCDAQSRPYFMPSIDVTRGQAAKIVANTFFLLGEQR